MTMKRTVLTFLLLFASLVTGLARTAGDGSSQILRCRYVYSFKKDSLDDRRFRDTTMLLDVYGSQSVFYSGFGYLRDSSLRAMENAGMSLPEMMAESNRLGFSSGYGEDFKYFIDFKKNLYEKYDYIGLISLKGKGELTAPEWLPAKDKSIDTVCGHPCRLLVGDYLGRRWTIWYATDIAVPAGPWLLWGAPGLIMQAVDSDRLFIFFARDIGYAPSDRRDDLMDNINVGLEHRTYPIRKMEMILNRTKRSTMEEQKYTGWPVFEHLDDGTMVRSDRTFPYIPLIPDEYWEKNKKR